MHSFCIVIDDLFALLHPIGKSHAKIMLGKATLFHKKMMDL